MSLTNTASRGFDSRLAQICALDVDEGIRPFRMTSVICTIGESFSWVLHALAFVVVFQRGGRGGCLGGFLFLFFPSLFLNRFKKRGVEKGSGQCSPL